MARFYFDFSRGKEIETDFDGLEFDSLEAAYLEAFRAAREIWAEMLERQEDPRELAFDIRDGAGRLLLTLPFAEVLQSTKRRRPTASVPRARKLHYEIERMQRLRSELSGEIVSAQRIIDESKTLLARSR